ncbi:MAG: ATP-binding protein [Myxococcota bacterium]
MDSEPDLDQRTQEPSSNLVRLPESRRFRDALVSLTPASRLQHHMVLDADVEWRFQRIEKEFAARSRLASSGLPARQRILLYGPPGCGKTLGAKRLAWNTGLTLMKVRFDTLTSSYFGETASNLRAIFEASVERPCLLLLDECDFIARSRSNTRDVGEAARVVNALLQLLEDYELPGLLVATTNVEQSLDKALFRRFDDVIHIPLPGVDEIEKLARMTLSSISVSERLAWTALAEILLGCSAHDVVRIAQDAAKLALLSETGTVEMRHLKRSIEDRNIFDRD